MKTYLVNTIERDGFSIIITLLDYRVQISRYLKNIRLSPRKKQGKLLIDTLLCSGMNEYRFIETVINDDGTINLETYDYIVPESDLQEIANTIVKNQPLFLINSVLSESQIKKILKD